LSGHRTRRGAAGFSFAPASGGLFLRAREMISGCTGRARRRARDAIEAQDKEVPMPPKLLQQTFGPAAGAGLWIKRAALIAGGVAALTLAAKISVPMWPSPVPINLGTFAVLTMGAAYGPRLALATILTYMALGALGADVFAGTSSGTTGVAYMLGATGGYLLGYVLAAPALGALAARGWDRSPVRMAGALLLGAALIYLPGVLWLSTFAPDWATTLRWGVTPYLIGDAIKLALAALLLPGVWALVGSARG
jgi:biotin transport system substrate-specific component